jgi:hypothetical protein
MTIAKVDRASPLRRDPGYHLATLRVARVMPCNKPKT